MIKVASFDIVFQEIPGEVTLALNLSGCPCHCAGCHSPYLWDEVGEDLTEELLDDLIGRYAGLITCVAFMGGDKAPEEVAQLAAYLHQSPITHHQLPLKAAWYSGRMEMPEVTGPFDYVKIGPYVESLGGLKSKTTNQRLYKRVGSEWQDITSSFWR